MATKPQKYPKRYFGSAKPDDDDLGPLKYLPGTWMNVPDHPGHGDGLPGRGWNMIALPFSTAPDSLFDYRLLMNQYNEKLRFTVVDKNVPNRGVLRNGVSTDTDQFVVTLDYQQTIDQIAAEDFPDSGKAGEPKLPIHHEPGLWLHMKDRTTNGIDIARLGSIPHGDAFLALGVSEKPTKKPPDIPAINALPIGVSQNVDRNTYLEPYKHFRDNPFLGLFDPTAPHALLIAANEGVNIVKTTKLEVSTTVETGAVTNIPFIVQQANAADMKSTFWIQELEEKDKNGKPLLRLQYLQVVILDFFPRRDGLPGLIRWPHVSINTMVKVA